MRKGDKTREEFGVYRPMDLEWDHRVQGYMACSFQVFHITFLQFLPSIKLAVSEGVEV